MRFTLNFIPKNLSNFVYFLNNKILKKILIIYEEFNLVLSFIPFEKSKM